MATNHIGARIKRYRGNITAEDLAQRIGNPRITRSVIANIESGRKPDPTITQLIEIASALRVPLAALVVDVEAPFSPIDLKNVSVSLFAVRNFELLEGVLSPDADLGGSDRTWQIIHTTRKLLSIDDDIHEEERAIRDRLSLLDDPELDDVQRAELEGALDWGRDNIKRLTARRSLTEASLRTLGVQLEP